MGTKQRRGFSLIELLVVVSIITLLTSIGLATFTNSQKKARDARRQADLEAVRSALELYRADNPATGYPNNTVNYAGLATPLLNYINPLPSDPKPPAVYTYVGVVGGTTYTLTATQEVLLPTNYQVTPP